MTAAAPTDASTPSASMSNDAHSKSEGPNGYDHYDEEQRLAELNRLRSAASISVSPEMLEMLYLNPPNRVKGELRKTFANPTPVGLAGFLLAATPLSCDLMGWRGAGGGGAATVGVFYFMGGLLMVSGGILEFFLGQTFSSVVFFVYGGFWLSFAATLTPSFAAYASYAPAGAESLAAGLETQGFNATTGFWLVFMGLMTLIFLICATRTNMAFVILFFSLTISFSLNSASYFVMAADYAGNAASAHRLAVGGGACLFVTAMAGWWIMLSIMLAVVDFPVQLPVGDLSTVIKGKSARSRV